jgi:leucyl-tRNA synthetase
MSKSKGNVVTPDSVAASHGADALRIYLLFIAPFENNTVWEDEGITGAHRFLQRTWRLVNDVATQPPCDASGDRTPPRDPGPRSKPSAWETERPRQGIGETGLSSQLHRTIQRVTADVEALKFNTAVAALMECLNAMIAHRQVHGVTEELARASHTFILLLAPFAPHIAEELWARIGGAYSVHQQAWPEWDERLTAEATFTLVVQVDGRVRDRLEVPVGIAKTEAQALARSSASVHRHIEDRRIVRVVYVPGRLVNVVTAP